MSSLSNIIPESKIYSDPVLYFVITYTVLIGCLYYFYKGSKTFIFGQNKKLDLIDLVSYPYGINTPQSIIKSFFSNPIQIFGLLFTLLLPNLIDVNESKYKPYFYGLMCGFITLLILFLIHVAIVRLVIDPKTIVISDSFKVEKKTGESYNNIYRGHWIVLVALLPIYSTLIVLFKKHF